MFLTLIWVTIVVVALGMVYTYRRTGDVFHPVMVVFPMFGFIYGWMPLHLSSAGILAGFFYPEQLCFVQSVNLLGIIAFFIGSLFINSARTVQPSGIGELSELAERRLLLSAAVTGLLGLTAWMVSIRNVGGIVAAFSHPYSGGWDESGYIRDGSLVMFSAVILAVAVLVLGRRKRTALGLVAAFILPWMLQALLTSRRGPCFMICAVLALAWFMYRQSRPPIAAVLLCGLVFGYGILFLVVNRNQIYFGSNFELTANVDSYVQTNDGSNEYIYGAASILDSHDYTHKYYWGRRYLAQILVRPIPSAVWPNKYEDFGVADLLKNAGNSTSFVNTLGWDVPPGAAPGIVADLWVEMSWFAIPALFVAGRVFSWFWSRAVTQGYVAVGQYCVCVALSLYFVMQTMEAVIFRFFLLSVPLRLAWSWANRYAVSPPHARHLEALPVSLSRSNLTDIA